MKKKKTYINFPVTLLRKLWSGTEGNLDIKRLAAFIVNYGLLSEQISDNNNSRSSLPSELLKLKDCSGKYDNAGVDNFVKRIIDSTTKLPMTGIDVNLLTKFVSSVKSDFDIHCLVAFLAIKSIIGPKRYNAIKWEFIIARMCGYKSVQELHDYRFQEQLQWAKWYEGRRGKAKMLNSLIGKWHLAYIPSGKGIRTPYYSFVYTEEELKGILLDKGKQPMSMKSLRK